MVLENDILGSEIGSGFRELDAKSAQPPPPGMKLANYSSTVAGVETVHIFCGNCQRSQSYKVLAILFFWIHSGKSGVYILKANNRTGSHPQAIGKMCRKKYAETWKVRKIAFKNAQGENRFKKTRTWENQGCFGVNLFGWNMAREFCAQVVI